MKAFIHPTSNVSEQATVGDGTKIWLWCQVLPGAVIGSESILGKSVYIDSNVRIGNKVKIQNNVSVYHGVEIEDGVFIGPHVCFTNDKVPRAITPDGKLKSAVDWKVSRTVVAYGASLGANSTIVCGTRVGRWAMVAAGAVVTHDVPDHALVAGCPARQIGWVCTCGKRLTEKAPGNFACDCGFELKAPAGA